MASLAEAKEGIQAGGCEGLIAVLPGCSLTLGAVVGGNTQTILADATVTLYGEVVVPNVVGKTRNEASLSLAAAGLRMETRDVVVHHGDPVAGTAPVQSIASGLRVTYQSFVQVGVAIEEGLVEVLP